MGDTTWTYTTEGNTSTDATSAGVVWGVVDSGTTTGTYDPGIGSTAFDFTSITISQECSICKEQYTQSGQEEMCHKCYKRGMLWVAKRAYFEAQLAGEVVHGPREVG